MNHISAYHSSESSSSSSSSDSETDSKLENDRRKKKSKTKPTDDNVPKLSYTDVNAHLRPINSATISHQVCSLDSAAPDVMEPTSSMMSNTNHLVDISTTKELSFNPKYKDLYMPAVGPENPFLTERQKSVKNMLNGYVEPAHLNDFQFDLERKTFHSYGYAHDPSNQSGNEILFDGAKESTVVSSMKSNLNENSSELRSVFEDLPSDRDGNKRRKKVLNKDASDIDGYLGPWAKYEDQVEVSQPSVEDKEYLEEYLAKRRKRSTRRKVTDEEKDVDSETSTLHIKDAYDYQNRSYLHPPPVDINLKHAPDKCFLPKRQVYEWPGGHGNSGVATIKWFPNTAHLLLSGGMDCKIKLWEVFNNRRCVRSFLGHKQAVRDTDFNLDGTQFLSTGYDRHIKLWDTETGDCVSRFTTGKIGYCVKFNPDEDKQHLFVAGMSDKKIVCWDTRSGDVVQEYDRHLGSVNTITFVDSNRRIVSTSDDKSLRVWDWDIPVDIKYIADPTMHSMPVVAKSPNQKWLACQSLDNRILIYTAGERVRLQRKKEFKGHMVAGYACGIDFSPDMSYLVSGDGDGKCCIWDWKTTRMVSKFKAHSKACVGVLWHPHETSKLATCGWDGKIKYWD